MQNKQLETEANVFAALLLIPKKFFEADVANVGGKRSGKTHEPSTVRESVRRYVYHVLAFRACLQTFNNLK